MDAKGPAAQDRPWSWRSGTVHGKPDVTEPLYAAIIEPFKSMQNHRTEESLTCCGRETIPWALTAKIALPAPCMKVERSRKPENAYRYPPRSEVPLALVGIVGHAVVSADDRERHSTPVVETAFATFWISTSADRALCPPPGCRQYAMIFPWDRGGSKGLPGRLAVVEQAMPPAADRRCAGRALGQVRSGLGRRRCR